MSCFRSHRAKDYLCHKLKGLPHKSTACTWWLLISSAISVAGCRPSGPVAKPSPQDVTGSWTATIEPQTRVYGLTGGIPPTIHLSQNGNFIATNIPYEDWEPLPPVTKIMKRMEGSWRIDHDNQLGWCIGLETSAFKSVFSKNNNPTYLANSIRIINRRPPYNIEYIWVEPGSKDNLVFTRNKLNTSSSPTSMPVEDK